MWRPCLAIQESIHFSLFLVYSNNRRIKTQANKQYFFRSPSQRLKRLLTSQSTDDPSVQQIIPFQAAKCDLFA